MPMGLSENLEQAREPLPKLHPHALPALREGGRNARGRGFGVVGHRVRGTTAVGERLSGTSAGRVCQNGVDGESVRPDDALAGCGMPIARASVGPAPKVGFRRGIQRAMTADPAFSILIADDDHAWRETLQAVLESMGYRIHTAANGREAVQVAGRVRVDCLLVDMHMPEMTGLEAVQTLRASRIVVPSILITAEPSEQVIRWAVTLEVFRVLEKPVAGGAVRTAVRQALASTYGAA